MEQQTTYWPGTTIAKSSGNGFTTGLRTSDADWADLARSAAMREKSSALVERLRFEGRDTSTIHGLTARGDRGPLPHGGTFSRAKPRIIAEKVIKPPRAEQRGPNKMALLRRALIDGPKTNVELAALIDVPIKLVRNLMQYDVEHGRVVKTKTNGTLFFALPEAERA